MVDWSDVFSELRETKMRTVRQSSLVGMVEPDISQENRMA